MTSNYHVRLEPSTTNNKRILIIGDIHGCLNEFQELLVKAEVLDNDNHQINQDSIVILAGDMVNKGPKCFETVKYIQTLGPNLYCVRGNHEDLVIEELPIKPSDHWTKKLNEQDLKFLMTLPYTLTLPALNIIVVHAGLFAGIPITEQTIRVMTWTRNIITDDTGKPLVSLDHDREGCHWAKLWKGPEHVFYGHDSRRGHNEAGDPIIQCHDYATGLDTGCVTGICLTGMFISPTTPHGQGEVVSVRAIKNYRIKKSTLVSK